MIKIITCENASSEKTYILKTLLEDFLGLQFILEVSPETKDYEIFLENGNKLIIEDHFFSKYPKDLEYLNTSSIPSQLKFFSHPFAVNKDIPILYGVPKIVLSNSLLTCGIDIFASCFFMLTRWEEYVNPVRDKHNRFPASESTALKHGFLHRPVVNEYVEMLWNMLEHLGINQKRPPIKSRLYVTHDVDHLYFWKSRSQLLRLIAGDILKRRNLPLAIHRWKEYLNVQKGKIPDPFDTFDWLMEQSERIGEKSRFYFMSGGQTKYDNHYSLSDRRVDKLMSEIKKRGHLIGIHPSYDTYNDAELLKVEKKNLEQITGRTIEEGRQHYLRFEVPTTWQCWEDAGLKIDSTCGYADKEGFRCGTGDTFSVFNILTRQQLKLKERPLIVMDGTLFHYQSYNHEEARKATNALRNRLTSFTVLWHNSFGKHKNLYHELLQS